MTLTDLAERTKAKKRRVEISEAEKEAEMADNSQEGVSQTTEKQSRMNGMPESPSPSPAVPQLSSRVKGKQRVKGVQEARSSPLVHDTKTSPPTLGLDAVDVGEEELDDEEGDDDISADKIIASKRSAPAVASLL